MIWNCATGAKLCETDTENQVSGIHWNQNYRELITGHGYPNNVLKIWKYPKFTHITVSQHYYIYSLPIPAFKVGMFPGGLLLPVVYG